MILVLFSEDSSQPATHLLESGLTEGTSAAGVAAAPVLFFEYLDATRYEDQEYKDALKRFLLDKYRGHRIDLVVPISQSAIEFTAAIRHELWPDVPILFASTHNVTIDPARMLPEASGIIFRFTFDEALATMQRVLPDARRLVLIRGVSTLERTRTATVPETARRAGFESIDLTGLTLKDLTAAVGRLPHDSLVYIAGPILDSSGQLNPAFTLCELITRSADVPAFTTGGQFLGCGVLGGRMRDFKAMGRLLGERALTARTDGRRRVEVVPAEAFTTLAFDARALARWRVPESRLPAGSVVAFRAPSLWHDYRGQVLAVAGALVFQMALIAGLLYERRYRLKAEAENSRSLALTARIDRLSAMTELSGSIAHELSQPLGSILHNAAAAQMMLASNRDSTRELHKILDDIRNEDLRASRIVQRHRAIFKHREMRTQQVDLNAVAQECVAIVGHDAARREIVLDVDLWERPCEVLGDPVLLQQVVLNLLLNAMDATADAPSDRRHVALRTAVGETVAEVTVVDRGCGIASDLLNRMFEPFVTTKPDGMGIGLAISRSIVEAHGGAFKVRNNAEYGATFSFTVPRAPA